MKEAKSDYDVSSTPTTPSKRPTDSDEIPPGTPSSLQMTTPRAPPPTPITGAIADDERDSKEEEIHTCLNPTLDESVDLIRLRILALSPGGLKSTALRRKAWPKLVAAHEVLWDGVGGSPPLSSSHSSEDVIMIQRLVRRTKWSKHQITKSPKTFDELLGLVLSSESTSIAPPTPSLMDSSNQLDIMSPIASSLPSTFTNRTRRVSFDLPLDNDDEDAETSSKLKEKERLRQLSRDERQVLRKLLLHLQRRHPSFELYDGLQNLLAVLWIVLESPSLTSITSLQLVQYQWQTPGSNEIDDDDLFLEVLLLWDPVLYDHLITLGYEHTPPCIAKSWIPHWFAQDLKDLEILLRIWDVLIVSPPIAIVYFSVALTVYFREPLLRASQKAIFQAILEHLPGDGLEKYDDQVVEQIVQECLRGIEEYPMPPQLPTMPDSPSRRKRRCAPAWSAATEAPTDWQVLKNLKQLRQNRAAAAFTESQLDQGGSTAGRYQADSDLEPSSPPTILTTSTKRTSRAFPVMILEAENGSTSLETPDATPCSTPESVAALAEAKGWHNGVWASGWSFTKFNDLGRDRKLVLACASVIFAFLLISQLGQTKSNSTETHPELEKSAGAIVKAGSISGNLPHASISASLDSGLERLEHYPECYFASPIEANIDMLLLKHGDQNVPARCTQNTEWEYLSPIEVNIESLYLASSVATQLGWRAIGYDFISPIETDVDIFLQSKEAQPAEYQPPPEVNIDIFINDRKLGIMEEYYQFPDLYANNLTADVEQVDQACHHSYEPSAVPTLHIDTGAMDNNHGMPSVSKKDHKPNVPSQLLGGISHFVLDSTQTHLQSRKEVRLALDSTRFQSILAISKAGAESQPAPGIVVEGREKRVENIGENFHSQQDVAAGFAMQATRARLEASLVARDHVNHAALDALGASKNMTMSGLNDAYGMILTATNISLNMLGRVVRVVDHGGRRARSFVSKDISQALSGVSVGIQGVATRSDMAMQVLGRGSSVANQTVLRLSQGAHVLVRSREREAGRGLVKAQERLPYGSRRVISIVRKSSVSTFRALGNGAVSLGRAAEQGRRDVGKLSLHIVQGTLRISKSAVILLAKGARVTIKSTEKGSDIFHRGRKQASTSASVLCRKSVAPVKSAAKSIVAGVRRGVCAANDGRKHSATLILESDIAVLTAARAGARVLVRAPHHSLQAIGRGSRYACKTLGSSSLEMCQVVKQRFALTFDSVATNSRRTYDVALVSTNTTLNVLGRGAKLSTRLVEAGVVIAGQEGENFLQAYIGALRRRTQIISIGTIRFIAAVGTSAVFKAIEDSSRFASQAGQHSIANTLRAFYHGSKLGASFVAQLNNKSYSAAVIATNNMLNGLGLVLRKGIQNAKEGASVSTKASLQALGVGRRTARRSLNRTYSASAKGLSLTARQNLEGVEMWAAGTKAGSKTLLKVGRFASRSVANSYGRALRFAEHGAKRMSHVAMLSTNATLNVVGTGTVSVVRSAKLSIEGVGQSSTRASRATLTTVNKASRSFLTGAKRGLITAGMGVAKTLSPLGDGSKAVGAVVAHGGVTSITALGVAKKGAFDIIEKSWVAVGRIVSRDTKQAGQLALQTGKNTVRLTRKAMLSILSWMYRLSTLCFDKGMAGKHTLQDIYTYAAGRVIQNAGQKAQPAEYANQITRFPYNATKADAGLIRLSAISLIVAFLNRLDAVTVFVSTKLKKWAEGVSHIGWQTVPVVGAAIVVAFGFFNSFARGISQSIFAGGQHGLDLMESLALGVKSTATSALKKAFPYVTNSSPTTRQFSTPTPSKSSRVSVIDAPTHVPSMRNSSRRARGAADLAREALRKENAPTLACDGKAIPPQETRFAKCTAQMDSTRRLTQFHLMAKRETSEVFRRLWSQSMDIVLGGLSQGALFAEIIAQRSLLSVHQRVQTAVGRTKEMIRLCMFAINAVGEGASLFLDKLSLQGQYALSMLEVSLGDKHRDLVVLVQEVDRILALRKARELALLAAYNLLVVVAAFVEVGQNKLNRSSERRMPAVLQVDQEAWNLVDKAAGLRMEGMSDARQAILISVKKTKDKIIGRFREKGDKVKDGMSSLGRHLPFYKRLATQRDY